jgi:hypothetical protein
MSLIVTAVFERVSRLSSLSDAAQAYRDLEGRKTTGSSLAVRPTDR